MSLYSLSFLAQFQLLRILWQAHHLHQGTLNAEKLGRTLAKLTPFPIVPVLTPVLLYLPSVPGWASPSVL